MTIEPISDERLAEIRAGLEGVTPGPWTVEADEREYRGGTEIVGYDIHGAGQSVVGCEGIDGSGEKVAAHIARLDPQTVAALLSRLDKAEAGEPDEARIAAARERAEALGPGMPGIMRTAFADIAENAIRQYFRPLPPPPSES